MLKQNFRLTLSLLKSDFSPAHNALVFQRIVPIRFIMSGSFFSIDSIFLHSTDASSKLFKRSSEYEIL